MAVIDTESDPGSYADALRFPNSITVIDGGTGRSKPAVTPAGNDPPPPAGAPFQRRPGSALNEAPAMVCTELPIAGADVSIAGKTTGWTQTDRFNDEGK